MSYLSRILRGTFNTSMIRRFSSTAASDTVSTAATTAAATTSNPKQSLSSIVNNERNPKRIVEKFKKACESEKFRADIAVYDRTVRRLVAAKRLHWVKEILEEQKKYREMSKEGFTARIISLYGKAGMFKNAQKVFDEMPERNCKRSVWSFNALLSAYGICKKFDVVEELFRDLPSKLSIEPDIVSYNTLIKALCEKGSLSEAIALLDEIEKNGLKPDVITFNTLLLSSYLKGQFEVGEEIWVKTMEKNVAIDIRTYNARLLGLALEMRSKEQVELFEELKASSGIKPDVFSFNAMIRGSINEGKIEEAKSWYNEIAKNGYRPGQATFTLLLPAMCKIGDFGSAFELCKEIFSKRYLVAQVILQQVVNELLKESKKKEEEAKEIVELAKTNNFLQLKLDLACEKQ